MTAVAKVGTAGYTPGILVRPVPNPERAKYERMWEQPAYRRIAPGEQIASAFLQVAKPNKGDTVIDFGCGTGRGGLMLAAVGGLTVTLVDFASNCLDSEVHDALSTQSHVLRFVEADLEKPLTVAAKYGYCTDVLEHIPPSKVGAVLQNILKAAQHVFFQISTTEDSCGKLIGEPLHLTVRPFEWWLHQFRSNEVIVHWAQKQDHAALFYVTAWMPDTRELVRRGTVNTSSEEIKTNILANIVRKLPQAQPWMRQETEIMILGGGPSLEDFWSEIIERRTRGMPLVTINGTYNQVLERGITPSAQIIVDARAFNKRFVQPTVPGCKYLLASQVHPSVFDAVPPEQTTIWHAAISEELCNFLDEHIGQGMWYPVPGGSTAMLRSFTLLRMLGFYRFHVYGFDSCLRDDKHHAYEQKENDYKEVISVTCGGKAFRCHVWMASQAQEFIDQIRMMGDEVKMIVYGDHLTSHILQTGADAVDAEVQEAVLCSAEGCPGHNPPGVCT